MKYFIFSILLVGSYSFAQKKDHPHCNDMVRFSCAPGEYDDGTGKIKSDREMRKKNQKLVQKYQDESEKRVLAALENKDDVAFREVAKAVLGLTHADQCESEDAEQIEKCNHNLAEGLSTLVEKEVLGDALMKPEPGRVQSIQELSFLRKNETYEKIVKDLKTSAGKELNVDEKRAKLKKELPNIKKKMLARIDSMPIDEDHKKLIKKRILITSIADEDCQFGQGPDKTRTLASIVTPNAHLDPESHKIFFCNSFLDRNESEFSLIFTLVHELAHTIDPCTISIGPRDLTFDFSDYKDMAKMQREYPFSNLLSCLREENSVHAKRLEEDGDDTTAEKKSEKAIEEYNQDLSSGDPKAAEKLKEKTKAPKDNPFCITKDRNGKIQGPVDQAIEAIPDWFAMELTPDIIAEKFNLSEAQYRIGYSNIYRDSCVDTQSTRNESMDTTDSSAKEFDTHSDVYKRINAMILTNPKVRKQMGCSEQHPKYIYCSGDRKVTDVKVQYPSTNSFKNSRIERNKTKGKDDKAESGSDSTQAEDQSVQIPSLPPKTDKQEVQP